MMKRLYNVLAVTSILGLISGCERGLPEIPEAQMTLQLVDDDGRPVARAKIDVVGFHTFKEGKTDEVGRFVTTLRNASGEVDLEAKKEGFYSINRQTYIFTTRTNGQWLPWNPTIDLRLHKIGMPVPMVVKQVEEYLPVLDESVGFDLLTGDWVQPYGKGITNDFVIRADRHLIDAMNHSGTLSLDFANIADGLIRISLGSRNDYGLRLAAQAPVSGYESHWSFNTQSSRNPTTGLRDDYANFSEDDNYYFRVRSQTNNHGEVTSAMYGKIYWGIHYCVGNTNATFRGKKTNPMPWVRFKYYLNPDGTRNTEFDTRSNLCANPGTAGGRP